MNIGEKNILKPGAFYILEPGETEFISNVIEEATILAIRLPSIPNNNIGCFLYNIFKLFAC